MNVIHYNYESDWAALKSNFLRFSECSNETFYYESTYK